MHLAFIYLFIFNSAVQVVTSEMGSVPKIHAVPATTDNSTLSANHDAFANAQQEYGPITNLYSFENNVEEVAV